MPLSGPLVVKKRLEHARQHLGVDPVAGIADLQGGQIVERVVAGEVHIAGADADRAAVRHRIARVDDDIDEGALELRHIDEHRPHPLRQLEHQLDVLARRCGEHIARRDEALAQVGDDRVERLTARKGQEPPRQGLAARRRVFDRLDRAQ